MKSKVAAFYLGLGLTTALALWGSAAADVAGGSAGTIAQAPKAQIVGEASTALSSSFGAVLDEATEHSTPWIASGRDDDDGGSGPDEDDSDGNDDQDDGHDRESLTRSDA